MRRLQSILLAAIFATAACTNGNDFESKKKNKSSEAPQPGASNPQSNNGGVDGVGGSEGLDPNAGPMGPGTNTGSTPTSPSTPGNGGTICVPDDVPVQVITLFDSSTSMTEYIPSLAMAIANVNMRIKNLVPAGGSKPLSQTEAKLVAFGDLPLQPALIPTADSSSLQDQIYSYQRGDYGNQDGPEYGLKALDVALDNFLQTKKTVDDVLVVLMVTDDFSHNGGTAFNRDFSIVALLQKLKNPTFKNLLIYDVTPSMAHLPTTQSVPWATPPQEWQTIRSGFANGLALSRSVGRGLGFPGEMAGTLENLVVDSIAQDLSAMLKVCR